MTSSSYSALAKICSLSLLLLLTIFVQATAVTISSDKRAPTPKLLTTVRANAWARSNCPYLPGFSNCWAISAYFSCSYDKSEALSYVMEVSTNKLQYERYTEITTTGAGCTGPFAWDPSNCVAGDKQTAKCWGNTAYQKCNYDSYTRQWAYSEVRSLSDQGSRVCYERYQELLTAKEGCTEDAPWNPANCISGDRATSKCWGNHAYQKCPGDRQAAYSAVRAKADEGDKASYDEFMSLVESGTYGCTA